MTTPRARSAPAAETNRPTALRALADSALALLAACAALAMFLPPLAAATTASLPRTLAAGGVIVLALPLHWLWLGRAARQLGRGAAGWVGLSMAVFPVGSAAALILLAGLLHTPSGRPALQR